MNLVDVFFPEGPPDDLRQWGLVMPQSVRDSLIQKQDEANITLHRVNPVALTNGDWALNADVLSEAREGGLFCHVELLNPDNIAQVQVMPWADVLALLPEPEIDDFP
jgi:hypothetical protein